MHLKLNSGIVGKGIVFDPGEVVDWKDDADCKRLIERGMATAATPEEIKTAGGKIKSYSPGKARPDEKWPPTSLRKLKGERDRDGNAT